jgi:hypothetical protein
MIGHGTNESIVIDFLFDAIVVLLVRNLIEIETLLQIPHTRALGHLLI